MKLKKGAQRDYSPEEERDNKRNSQNLGSRHTDSLNNDPYNERGMHNHKPNANNRYNDISNSDQESVTSSVSDRHRGGRRFGDRNERFLDDSYDHRRYSPRNSRRGSTSSTDDEAYSPSRKDYRKDSNGRNKRKRSPNRRNHRDLSSDSSSYTQDSPPRRRHHTRPEENRKYPRNGKKRPQSSHKYDDPWDTPSKENYPKRSPSDKHGSKRHYSPRRTRSEVNSSDEDSLPNRTTSQQRSPSSVPHSPVNQRSTRRNSTPDKYEDPWDRSDLNLHILSRSPEKPDSKHVNNLPMSMIHKPKQATSAARENENNIGKYKSEDGHITVDLGPGIYKPASGIQPPTVHSQSREKSHSKPQVLSRIKNYIKQSVHQSYKLHDDQHSGSKHEDEKSTYGQDENEERGNWSGKFDFILSMLGYAVGLGNVWRFPYLCYRNGGGAFLFPFLLMMICIGLPLFYLEGALGQFSSSGAMTCWHFAPLFKGLGIAMVAVSGTTSVYYNMIIAWSLHYMFSSFTSDLPFSSCQNKWNTKDCKLKLPEVSCDENTKAEDGLCVDENNQELGLWNKTLFTEVTGRVLQSPSQEYWERFVLNFSDGIQHYGFPKWDLVLCLLLAWVICFLCLIKGIKTTGKVVYFTALFPYVVLIILLFRGVTLENAGIGIKYFITPNFERLSDASVWKDAANQVFFSMSIAGGGLITLSSYNRFTNNILRDSIIVAVGDSGTCLLGGFVIFSFLGYMAGQLHVDIEDVAADGAGLAFVVYPEAVSNLPPPTLWAILFFIMLLTLGLDSQFAMVETVLTGMLDQYPHLRPRKTFVILVICIILFILGLPLACPGGMYMLQLMDNYVGGMTLIIIGFFEIIAVVFVYGINRFCQDIHLMTGSTWFLFWKITWRFLSPLTIAFIFIYMFVDYKPSTYDKYVYPTWADVIGWFMTIACVLPIPVVMVYKICREPEGKTILQKIRLLCLPTVFWGPALRKHRVLVNYVKGFQVDPFKGLQPRTSFVNYGYDNSGETSTQTDSQGSLAISRISIISAASKGTAATAKSGMSYETNV